MIFITHYLIPGFVKCVVFKAHGCLHLAWEISWQGQLPFPFTYFLSLLLGHMGNLWLPSISNCDPSLKMGDGGGKEVSIQPSSHFSSFPIFLPFPSVSPLPPFRGYTRQNKTVHFIPFLKLSSAQFGLLKCTSINMGDGGGREVKPAITNVLHILPFSNLISYT